MQHLSKRLYSQMTNNIQGPDIIKAANSLHELGILFYYLNHVVLYIIAKYNMNNFNLQNN